jgi:uncharacterized protein DUF973
MSGSTCPACGGPTAPGSGFCPSCGAALAENSTRSSPEVVSTSPVLSAQTLGPVRSREGPTFARGNVPRSSVDHAALSSVSLAAVLGLVGVVASFVVALVTPFFTILSFTTSGSVGTFSLNISGVYLVGGIGSLGVIFTFLELWFFRRAFRRLLPQDHQFATPARLVLYALLAVVLFIASTLGLLWAVYQQSQCNLPGSLGPSSTTCLNLGMLTGILAVDLFALLLLLLGSLGLALGIWRLGTRYGDSRFKIGAVCVVIPFASFAGALLILVASRSVSHRIRGSVPRKVRLKTQA